MEQSAPFVVPRQTAPPGGPDGGKDQSPGDAPPERDETPARPGGPGRVRGTPSIRPALVVIGVAALLVTLFGIGAALSGGTPQPAPHSSSSRALAGTALPAEAARSVLATLENRGTPPTDVFDAVLVPKGSVVSKLTPWTGLTQYSATASLQVDASQAAVIDFFKALFGQGGWHVFSTGPARNDALATEVLAQRASDDGWYWDAGATVHPSRFGATGTDTTSYTLKLFEVPDAQ